MAVITTYKCDKCGKEWHPNSGEEMPVAVGIVVEFGKTTLPAAPYKRFGAMWCRECVMKSGIHPPMTEADKQVAPEQPLSFEEKFAVLMEELGFARQE